MTRNEIRGIVSAIAYEVFEADPEDFADEADLERDLGATSLMLTEFAVALERRFNIAFNAVALEQARSLADVVLLIEQSVARAPA